MRRFLVLCGAAALMACGGQTNTNSTGSGGANGSGGRGGESATGTTTSDQGAAGPGGSGQGGSGGKPEFILEAQTSAGIEGAIHLDTNVPIDVAACTALDVSNPPCDDKDEDGLVDLWEDTALDHMRPLLRLDEEESLVNDPAFVVAIVARVAPVADQIHMFMMIGYSKDFGSCGFTSHNGDSERVALRLEREPDVSPGAVRVFAAYTAAHEGTASDHSMLFQDASLQDLTVEMIPNGGVRWVVFPSQDKHGTYGSIDICENISVVPCFDEDCAPDGAADPAAFDRLPPFVNAGEEAHPLVTSLAGSGFPGDDAWANQDFCGGLGGNTCSAPVRDKLLVSPF